jgi:hypothetical protein
MTVFCTLHIRSDVHAELPGGFLLSRKRTKIDFVDNSSPEMRERRSRVRSKLGLKDVAIPRYHWRLSSEGAVTSDDIHEHLLWILGRISSELSMNQSLGSGFEYWFSVFWQGNGTGGGPLITLQTAELLVRHKAEMAVSFYVES